MEMKIPPIGGIEAAASWMHFSASRRTLARRGGAGEIVARQLPVQAGLTLLININQRKDANREDPNEACQPADLARDRRRAGMQIRHYRQSSPSQAPIPWRGRNPD
jgi:hypothetical protein